MTYHKDIEAAFQKATDQMNACMMKVIAEDFDAFVSKTPDEYKVWRERRNRDAQRSLQLDRCRWRLQELMEQLASEEKSLAYLEDDSNYK